MYEISTNCRTVIRSVEISNILAKDIEDIDHAEASAAPIETSYNDQTDFTRSNNSTNLDTEAIVAVGDILFLFSMNWENLITSVTKIPKSKGKYQVDPVDG